MLSSTWAAFFNFIFYWYYFYMQQPTFTISGYRGIWGETLNPEIATNLAQAFSQYLQTRDGKTIIVGRDARPSGREITDCVANAITKAGFDVIDVGILPTPTILLLIRKWGLSGGIIITASHNPAEYNGLKFASSEGFFLDTDEVTEMKDYLEKNKPLIESSIVGTITKPDNAGRVHIDTILSHIDVDAIREKNFKVVLDPINSAGATVTPELLQEFGTQTTVINGEPNGIFAHKPEPIRENLTSLGDQILKHHADVGFVQDPDADRLVVIDEKGTILNEEFTLALAVKAVMLKKPGTVVTNCSTSNINKLIAGQFKQNIFYTKVGEANVVEGIKKHNAIIGGEGSGGVIYSTINPCRDSLTGIALILELMAHENKKLSEIVAEFPPLAMAKDKIPFTGDLSTTYEKIKLEFPDAVATMPDGLRLDLPNNAWLLIRPSNTEPIVRIMCETNSESESRLLIEKIKKLL